MDTLVEKKCQPCEGGTAALDAAQIQKLQAQIPQWEIGEKEIRRVFQFKNYYQTMAFVNAIAWISHREDHHPDLHVSYKACAVTYTTHALGGLSENDFICAAKVDGLEKI